VNGVPNVNRILRGLGYTLPNIEFLANGCITVVLRPGGGVKRETVGSAFNEEWLTFRMNG
jgi:hypothetical protein